MRRSAPFSSAERLQRLAQVVAGGGQEAALGEVGAVGLAACFAQSLLDALAVGDIANRGGDQHVVALRRSGSG